MKINQSIIRLVGIAGLLGCSLLSVSAQKNTGKTRPPNIILILADDMGWADSELYGSTYYETPNLTRLAKEGMHFRNAYAASPLCSPTRASIMSGQHPARLRLTLAITPRDVAEPRALEPEANEYCGKVQNKNYMPLEVFTLAEALKEAGYHTAHIGKWHLSNNKQNGATHGSIYNAEHQGFDFVIGGDFLPGPPDYYTPYKNRISNLSPGPEGEYLNDRLARESIRWIESVKDSGAPFYLNFWQYAIHGPWIAKQDLLPKYQAKSDTRGLQDCPEMGTMIESLDHSIGILLDWLDLPQNKSVKDNTLLLFASDNGGVVHPVNVAGTLRQVTSNRPLRGGKANTYEGGTRIPWIVRWPKNVKAGSVSNTPVSTLDIYPTLLDITGTRPQPDMTFDGKNISGVFKGEPMEERPLFFDFPHVFGTLCASSSSVRLGDYKLIRFYWAGKNPGTHYYELFHLKDDPSEAINLASYMPEKVEELDALISGHLAATNALTPIPNKKFSGQRLQPRAKRERAPERPLSVHLPTSTLVVKKKKGRRTFQLLDENGKPRKTAALVLEGAEWIRLKEMPDGQVELSWNRQLKKGNARVLFAWSGGKTMFEMNDWTLQPFELTIEVD